MESYMQLLRQKSFGDAKQGISHLRSHFKSCKLRTTRDIKQSFLKTHKEGGEIVVVGNSVQSTNI